MIGRSGPARPLSCRQVRRALQSYLDGVLDDSTAERVARHLPGCLRCGQEAETYQAIKQSLARRESYPPITVARLREFRQAMQDQLNEPPDNA